MDPPPRTAFVMPVRVFVLALLVCAAPLAAGPAPASGPGPGFGPGTAQAGGLTGTRFARPPASAAPPVERLAPPPALERGAGAPVAWRDPNAALAEAKRDKKPILIDVEVAWSSWCTRMLRTTYADAGVREDIALSFVPVRLDAEEDDRRVLYGGRSLTQRALADRFRVATYPTTVFLAPDGTPITRVPGYVAPARFRLLLRYVAEGHYRRTTWEEFAGPPDQAPGTPPDSPPPDPRRDGDEGRP